MKTLKVRNWAKWQTWRKDRNPPPWIKVHKLLSSDWHFGAMTASERGQLLSVWLLAADRDGVIPADVTLVKKLTGLDELDLNRLIELEFLEGDVKVTPKRRQDGAPVQNRTVQNRKNNTSSGDDGDVDDERHFDVFWSSWPKKVAKRDALRAWKRLKDSERKLALEDSKTRYTGTDKHYVPNPATYLNGKRWEDERIKRPERPERPEKSNDPRTAIEACKHPDQLMATLSKVGLGPPPAGMDMQAAKAWAVRKLNTAINSRRPDESVRRRH